MKFFIFILGIFTVCQGSTIPRGTPAAPGEFPYLVSVRRYNAHLCNGAIVSANKIITAAHCCEGNTNPASYQVVAGSEKSNFPGPNEQVRGVRRIIIHPQYNTNDLSYDICVVTLDTDLDFSGEFVQPGQLAQSGDDPIGEATYPAWSNDGFLYKYKATTITNAQCTEAYGHGSIHDSNICAIGNVCDPCPSGNSGGPLVATIGGSVKIIGTMSWAFGCNRPGYPTVYTRISSVSSWIAQQ
jgi:secreted trypsin-like serine protease